MIEDMVKQNSKITLTDALFYICFIAIILFAIMYSSFFTWLIAISTIFGMLSSKTATEGKWITFIFDAVSYALYMIMCGYERYYGEIILSCLIIIIQLFSLFEWKRNQINDRVLINKLSSKEIFISLCCSVGICSVYYVLLYYLKTELPAVNAISTVVYLLGNYYSFRRSVLQFYCWVGYEITFMSLWIVSATHGEMGSIIFLIGAVSELVYAIYGIFNWSEINKQQQLIENKND